MKKRKKTNFYNKISLQNAYTIISGTLSFDRCQKNNILKFKFIILYSKSMLIT